MKVNYKEFEEALSTLKFEKEESKDAIIFSNKSFSAIIKLPNPASKEEIIQEGILAGHAFLLQEKGVITTAKVLFKILENQRFIRENVLA